MRMAWSVKTNTLVMASEYNRKTYGMVQCIDESCRVNVIFNQGNEQRAAHFKTTGSVESQHSETCGFYERLDPLESLEKSNEYQSLMKRNDSDEKHVIGLNLSRIDPDRRYETEEEEEVPPAGDVAEKKPTKPKKMISKASSVKAIVELLTKLTPDELSTIYFQVYEKGGYKRRPLNEIVLTQVEAHERTVNDNDTDSCCFVIGRIKDINRREKVIYINFYPTQEIEFSLVIFQKHFKYFTFTDEYLENKYCLVYGKLSINAQRQTTQMIIKSDDYIACFKKRKK